MRYTIDRKSWYNFVAGEFTEEDFAKVCNLSAKAVRSELYDKKLEFDAIFEAQVELIERLGNSLTLDKIKAAITGVDTSKDASFFSVWQDRINFFRTNNNGEQYTTAESYECAMKSFQKILWDRPITGFKVGKEDVLKTASLQSGSVVCEAASVCLTPCRAKPVAPKEAAIRGHIGADVVFGDQKHKLASLKNVSIILKGRRILRHPFCSTPSATNQRAKAP